MTSKSLTQDLLLELFEYKNGKLYWKQSPTQSVKAGQEVGSINKRGYVYAQINKKQHYVHRLIFVMHHGYQPKYIDHIDRNPSNNAIENLRDVTAKQSSYNTSTPKNNTSGVKNVNWHKASQKWIARIRVGTQRVTVGLFDNLLDAKSAIEKARAEYHKEFACHE